MEVDIDADTPDFVPPELNDSTKQDDEAVPTPSPSAVSDSSGASNNTFSQLKNLPLPKRIKTCFYVDRRVMILFNNTDWILDFEIFFQSAKVANVFSQVFFSQLNVLITV